MPYVYIIIGKYRQWQICIKLFDNTVGGKFVYRFFAKRCFYNYQRISLVVDDIQLMMDSTNNLENGMTNKIRPFRT